MFARPRLLIVSPFTAAQPPLFGRPGPPARHGDLPLCVESTPGMPSVSLLRDSWLPPPPLQHEKGTPVQRRGRKATGLRAAAQLHTVAGLPGPRKQHENCAATQSFEGELS